MNISSQFSMPITTYNKANVYKNNNVNQLNLAEEIKKKAQETSNNSDVWGKLSKEYDIHNASFDELCDMSTRLYQAGQITLFDHAMLTFDPSKSPQPVKPNLCLTEAKVDGKRDWITEYEARAARDLQMGNMTGYGVNENIVGILDRLQ